MSPSSGHRSTYPDFSLVLTLFFTSRLMLLMAFPPENLIFYGDYQHYFNLADLTRRGFYPYLNYWYEFPPIFPYLNIAVYTLAGQQLKNYILLLAFVLLLVECGNLYLLYRLAFTLYGRAHALTIAWIYTALFVPIFFWLGNFDALTTFFILLALYSLIKNKSKLLVAALGLGTMVKYLPIILLATVWRAKGFKAACLYGAATLVISLLIFGPFALRSPTFTLASLQAQAGKSSYETVWALLDGNITTGNFGPLADHFDPAKAAVPLNNPARLPSWLTLIPFGLLGLFILTRPRLLASSPFDTIIFTTLTFAIFFLWSPGWSPQWQSFLVPLLLLVFPEKRAVLFIIALGFINFLEWPVILSRGLTNLLPITIIARTLLFILLAVELYRLLTQPTPQSQSEPASVPVAPNRN
ncbi:MAG TPA: hypothetical protein VEC93_18555 [Anaerolineae bacterium]|nr:hypothetical protein [Anaerolineae bacterium]